VSGPVFEPSILRISGVLASEEPVKCFGVVLMNPHYKFYKNFLQFYTSEYEIGVYFLLFTTEVSTVRGRTDVTRHQRKERSR
jgi:hypothetical protein